MAAHGIVDDLHAADRPRRPACGRQALRSAGLPDDDHAVEDVILCAFAQGDGVVEYGGLEIYGENGLLRSIGLRPRGHLQLRQCTNFYAHARGLRGPFDHFSGCGIAN
jgi:hypothetical protein